MVKGILSLVIAALMAIVGVASAQVGEVPGEINPGGNNQVVSRDAIAVRVVPNPEHYSPLQWYNTYIQIKGAPQSLIVDGYEAVRDGRTVYVNAAKVARVKRCDGTGTICTSDRQCEGTPITPGETRLPDFLVPTAYAASCIESQNPVLYTNIYIISYNQEPEPATTDIFGQLLQFWKFNTDIKNCSGNPDRLCTEDAECGRTQVCQPTGVCNASNRACLLDSDCPDNEFCRNKKSAIIRDVRRLADLRAIKDRLEGYNTVQRTYPVLAQGTYVSNSTVSTWPSWQGTFKNTLGGELPTDPINKLGTCPPPYNPTTCWDETAKRYSAPNNPLTLPTGSYAYYYQYKAVDNTFTFCGITESGFIDGKTVGSPLCQVNNCASCDGRQCGTNGCGQSCGTCRSGQTCSNFRCIDSAPIGQEE